MIHDKIMEAFKVAFVDKNHNYFFRKRTKKLYAYFEAWKRELRHHDVTCDVVNLLDGVPQSTYYHPEFDALLHTFYVCRAVLKMGREDLLETAFLHDVGKGVKTTIGNGRIYHFGHPEVSVEFIDQNNIKKNLRNYEMVRRITNDHMKYEKNLNQSIDKDLYDFIKADKVISKELYKEDSDFINNMKNIFKEKLVYLNQKFSKKTLYVMVGIPGSGKSHFLKNVNRKKVVSSDEVRRELFGNVNIQETQHIPSSKVWEIISVRLRIALELYGEAYLDATNVNKFFRVKFMAPFNDCKKVAIVFDVDKELAIKRIREDIENGIDRSDVSEEVIYKMYKKFKKGEQSLKNEFNKVIYWYK